MQWRKTGKQGEREGGWFHGLQVETSMHCKEFFMSWHQCHLSPPVASLLFHQYICPISIWSYSCCSVCFSEPFLPSRGTWLWQAFTSPQFPLACGIRRYLQLHFLSDILSSSKFGSPSLSLQLFAYTFPVWMTSWYPRLWSWWCNVPSLMGFCQWAGGLLLLVEWLLEVGHNLFPLIKIRSFCPCRQLGIN